MNYEVTCQSCGGKNNISIDKLGRITWLSSEPIISARLRFDRNYGFQCVCGANDLLTPEESRYWEDKRVAPKHKEMEAIMKNLKIRRPMFEMEVVA